MLLIALEGVNDIAFMRSVSTILHRHDANLPDFTELETQKKVLFLPIGGGNVKDWMQRFASLHRPEFHLYDRELEPVTSERRLIVKAINQRPNCHAVLTTKRALENYLHPSTITQACGLDITFNDETDVPNLLARHLYARKEGRTGFSYRIVVNDDCGTKPRRSSTSGR